VLEEMWNEPVGKFTLMLDNEGNGEIMNNIENLGTKNMSPDTNISETETKSDGKIFKVVARQTFEMTYFVEAASEDDAIKTLEARRDTGVEEAGQRYMGEVIEEVDEVGEAGFEAWLNDAEKSKDIISSYWVKNLIIK